MKELFKTLLNLKEVKPLTTKDIKLMNTKKFHSGKNIKSGDTLLAALLVKKEYPYGELVFICEKDFDMYEPYGPNINPLMPLIKEKGISLS